MQNAKVKSQNYISNFKNISSFFFLLLLVVLWPNNALAQVNINTASLSELTTLTGVGEVIGGRIIDARPFSSIEDIKSVKGIGDVTYEKIKGNITVSGSSVTDNGAEDPEEDENDPIRTSSDDDSSNRVPINSLMVSVPAYAFVDQEVSFEAEPTVGTQDRLIRYKWNFGDGSVDSGREPVHHYAHSGTYMVVVESYYLGETKVARQPIEVLPLELSLSRELDGSVSITNNSSRDIDISGMKLIGQKSFVFPEHSWLMAGGKLTIPAAVLAADPINTITMHSFTGRLVASTYQGAEASLPPQSTYQSSPFAPTASSDDSSKEEAPNNETIATATTTEQIASTQAASVPLGLPQNAWPYLGLIGVMGVGLVAVYGTRIK